ncbi:MAG: hypothetical protein IKJ65_08300 [Clostridia bacterium]|nr:hypothetical protein [Clostridia bacterium]
MQFLGMFRHVRTSHAQGLTKEMFVSLGQSAVSAHDVFAQGGLIVMAEGEMRNRNTLARALKLTYDASMSLIITRAYRMWGADYPRHIEGNVVTAVIDRTEDRMILSSDRAGAIGVYYAWRGRSAAFASHPELLLKMGAAGRKIAREGICELFATSGFFTPGKTSFQDIRMLEGGCVLIADSRGMRVKRYYSLISESLKPEKAAFGISDYLQTLPQAEYALFLSSGLSKKMAHEIKEKGSAYLYHVKGSKDESSAFLALAEDMNAPIELESPRAESFADALKEIVTHAGFPGAGITEALLFPMMKEAFRLFPKALTGGMGAFLQENISTGNLLRFLKKDVFLKIDAQGYLRDRYNDLTDQHHLSFDDEESEARAKRILLSSAAAQRYASRMRLLAGAAGGEIQTPLMDERFLSSMIGNLPDIENTHAPEEKLSEECVLNIVEEATELSESEDQPIFEAVDPKAIKRELESEHADTPGLARLIQINSFLYQFEAELTI